MAGLPPPPDMGAGRGRGMTLPSWMTGPGAQPGPPSATNTSTGPGTWFPLSLAALAMASPEDDAELELVCLLDAVDELLRRREELAQTLSRGWINIASARYSMGPSRIDQSLFRLKPYSSSTLVSVTCPNRDHDQGANEDDPPLNFLFRISKGSNGASASDRNICTEPILQHSGLRHRHSKGIENYNVSLEESKLSTMDDESTTTQEDSDENSTKYVNMKQISEPLTWFGMLVSPHLRGAQSSFKEGLEILIDLATIQSTILSKIQKIKDDNLD